LTSQARGLRGAAGELAENCREREVDEVEKRQVLVTSFPCEGAFFEVTEREAMENDV
jgi:hypothetical protein